jgi:hypothetical protein
VFQTKGHLETGNIVQMPVLSARSIELAAHTIKPTSQRIRDIAFFRRLASGLLVTQCRLEIPYRPFPSYRKHANAATSVTHQLMATDAIGFWNWGERRIRLPSQRRRQIRWVDLPP